MASPWCSEPASFVCVGRRGRIRNGGPVLYVELVLGATGIEIGGHCERVCSDCSRGGTCGDVISFVSPSRCPGAEPIVKSPSARSSVGQAVELCRTFCFCIWPVSNWAFCSAYPFMDCFHTVARKGGFDGRQRRLQLRGQVHNLEFPHAHSCVDRIIERNKGLYLIPRSYLKITVGAGYTRHLLEAIITRNTGDLVPRLIFGKCACSDCGRASLK